MPASTPDDVPKDLRSKLDGLRVLIVEDSWQVGTGLKNLLETWGADVIGPVATAADAMQAALERSPDVALVDVSLREGERSYGLIDLLHNRGIRIVVLTGYADALPLQGKAVAVLSKPMSEDVLLASLISAQNQ
jgi:CheY-like chemotaxis protein